MTQTSDFDKKKIFRICDANLNRAKEGLRVVEEYIRFYISDEKSLKDVREIRHALADISKEVYKQILAQRDIPGDLGTKIAEGHRDTLHTLLVANFKRIQEALRVLEEFSKLVFKEKAPDFKSLRFKAYDLEKKIYFSNFSKSAKTTSTNPRTELPK